MNDERSRYQIHKQAHEQGTSEEQCGSEPFSFRAFNGCGTLTRSLTQHTIKESPLKAKAKQAMYMATRKTPIWVRMSRTVETPPRASENSIVNRCEHPFCDAAYTSLGPVGRTSNNTSPAGQPEGSHGLQAAVLLPVSPTCAGG